jgi:hypothetical protein
MALTTKTCRIFVSSTFSDLKEERNALQSGVLPRLRERCTGHESRFQAIDLRCGVREEAGLDQAALMFEAAHALGWVDQLAQGEAEVRERWIVLKERLGV